jgi:cyclophilin family peptidyl-prolyl cis-trans isomerase
MSFRDRFFRPASPRRDKNRSRLALEHLEGREVPATLAPISDITTPNTKDLYVPLTVTSTTGTVTYTATSSDPQVHADLVTGGTTIKMTVTGKAADGTTFTGDLTFRLFDSLAPTTTARIVQLVNQGFYNNLTFHRILAGFVAQGGDPLGTGLGGSGQKLNDELTTQLTFNSAALLAMANSGPDTSDSQFFITDPSVPLAPNLQSLNFRYTIFGQLVSGFDTFDKLIHTPVQSSSTGKPVSPVTITSATVVQNDPNGVLHITAPATYTGNSTITVTPSDGGASSTGDNFKVTFAADTVNDPPFLGPIADQTTTPGTGVTFQLTSTDLENDPVTYSIVSATNAADGSVVNITSKINQATGRVTVTPPAGFVGVINLKVGVKDATSTLDTQVIKVTVAGSFDLQTTSDTGTLIDDNVTADDTPTFTVFAPTGQTVRVTVNGTAAGNATETSTPGQYTITIPVKLLKTGANTIAGTATPAGGTATQLTAFTLTYNPELKDVYVVPGVIGASQQLTFQFLSAESNARSEYGFFKVDNVAGQIGTLKPGDAGYFAAAMARKQIVFAKGTAVGTSTNVTVNGGDLLVMYIVQDDTSANLLAQNPTNAKLADKPIAFFSLASANPDGTGHYLAASDPSDNQVTAGWEDGTNGGDRDFNDMVVNVRRLGDTLSAALTVPAGVGRGVTVTSTLQTPARASTGTGTATKGEIGVIVTDDATGLIGTLKPGDAGYAAAALARAQILFGLSDAANTIKSLSLTGGQNVMFYYVPGGTAAQVISGNPTNSGTGSKVAYFSITGANPDSKSHARSVGPEKASQGAVTLTTPLTVHMMGKLNGTAKDFDDVAFTVTFSS